MKIAMISTSIILVGLIGLSFDQYNKHQVYKKELITLRNSYYLYSEVNQRAQMAQFKESPFINFSLPDLHGNTWTLENIKAKIKIIVLFSANDCATCLQEYILWKKINNVFNISDIQIIGINHDPKINSLINFKEDRKIEFPILHDPEDIIRKTLGWQNSPLRITLNENNEILEVEKSGSNLESQKTYLKQLKNWLFRTDDNQ